MEINKDKRGSLIALENLKTVPFEIKRVYYIYDTKPDVDILIMMDGACEVLLDNGKEKKSIILNRPDVGLYIGKNMWREMKNFSYGAKLLVLASDFYDEKEYIRSYDEFLRIVNE